MGDWGDGRWEMGEMGEMLEVEEMEEMGDGRCKRTSMHFAPIRHAQVFGFWALLLRENTRTHLAACCSVCLAALSFQSGLVRALHRDAEG